MLHDYEPVMLEAFAERAPKWKTLSTLTDEDGHEIAYVIFTMNAPSGTQKRQTAIICDCDFKPDLGWHVSATGRAVFGSGGIKDPKGCPQRNGLLARQQTKLELGYQDLCAKLLPTTDADVNLFWRYRKGLLWLAELLEKGEIIDSNPHSFLPYPHFSACRAAEIFGEHKIRRVQLFAELLADTGKLHLNQDRIFVLPAIES